MNSHKISNTDPSSANATVRQVSNLLRQAHTVREKQFNSGRKTGIATVGSYKPELQNSEFRSIVIDLWAALDTAVSLSLAIMLRYDDISQILRKKINPSQYTDHHTFYLDYQAIKYIAKYEKFGDPKDKLWSAVHNAALSEVECRETNDRISRLFAGDKLLKAPSAVTLDIFRSLPKEMDKILGRCPEFSELNCDFGPGASFATRGDTSAYAKLRSKLEGTFAYDSDMISKIFANYPGWTCSGPLEYVPGSELTFVPKDGKTDRAICIEPLLNGFVQKGIGSYIRDQLLTVNVDIRKDQSRNGELARKANRLGLATVDLKSASDTISYMLVLHMLAEPWFELLSSVRSPRFLYDGVWRDFEKFSSMGNAYTFELETAIFLALARATCKKLGLPTENISVYGDDIIIPKEAYSTFRDVCQFCGFTINGEKTFVKGVFYESCGKDWFNGIDVRPIFLKKGIKTLRDRFRLINGLKAILTKVNDYGKYSNVDHRRCLNLWILINECVGDIPLHNRFRVPSSFGDIGIHCDVASDKFTRHGCWDGFVFYGLSHRLTKTRLNWELSDAGYTASRLPKSADPFGFVTQGSIIKSDKYKTKTMFGTIRGEEQRSAYTLFGNSYEVESEVLVTGSQIVHEWITWEDNPQCSPIDNIGVSVYIADTAKPKGFGYVHRASASRDVVKQYFVSSHDLSVRK